MNHSSIAWWVKNPIAANLLMVTLIVAGLFSYKWGVEKEPFPTVTMAVMDISVTWPGAGPRNIEEQIIVRFEEALKDVEDVKSIVSKATQGRAKITVTGKSRVDTRKFADDVRGKINAVNGLPSDVERPVVTERVNRQSMIRVALSGDFDERTLSQYAHRIRREIASLPLISNVQLAGAGREEISIELSQEAMRAFNISIDQVALAIRGSSISQSTGTVRDESGILLLSVRNRAEEQQQFEDIVIRRDSTGATVYLRDIATVIDGMQDANFISNFDGQPSVMIDVMNTDYMNIPKMSDYVREYIDAKQSKLPNGMKLTLWADWNDAYQSRLSTILDSALTGLVLVFCLLLLFLQLKVALWVTAGIATAFAASFALLPLFDVSLNMLSLFAFMMVIGIVVDDAIVIGESIHVAQHDGHVGDNAAIVGASVVAKPVIFGVLTTMVVFAPMAFLPGSTAEFTRAISIVVVLALSFSIVEALFILPSHLRHLNDAQSKPIKAQQVFSSVMTRFRDRVYQPLLLFVIRHKFNTLVVFIGVLALSNVVLENNYVRKSFMPNIESDNIRLVVTLPPNTSRERVLQVLEQINNGQAELLDYVETLGKGPLVKHFYNSLWGTRITSTIKLVPVDERPISIQTAANQLQNLIDDIPDAEDIEFKSTMNTKDPKIGFAMNSESIEALSAAVKDLKSHIGRYEGVSLIRDNLDKGSQELVISLKPGAEALGLNLREVSKQVKQAYFGQEVQRIAREGGDIRVRVRYSREERESIATLDTLMIRMRDGREIPLMTVADVTLQPGIQKISRKNGAKVGNIWAEYSGDNQQGMMKEIYTQFLPKWKSRHPEVKWGKGDRSQEEEDFMNTVYRLEGLALLISYMLMAIAFKSYVQPLLLLSVIPWGFFGAIAGHWIHDIEFGIFSMLGILAASGVVINDNLVLLDAVNRARQQGQSARDAIINSALLRFRPIVLTSLTTFIGLLPMLSAQSAQAKFLLPMVISLGYGVITATIVTLILVPCLYLMGDKLNTIYSQRKHRFIHGTND